MTDEQKRIKGYLTAQGAKLAPVQIVDKVREAMEQLRAGADAVPAARFTETPEPGEWSANEVMAHVVDAGRHFGGAIEQMIQGKPASPAERERDTAQRSSRQWWAILEKDRSALFDRVLAVDPSAHLDLTVDHTFFGPLNWREALLFMRLHDLDHAGQMQKIVTALSGRTA